MYKSLIHVCLASPASSPPLGGFSVKSISAPRTPRSWPRRQLVRMPDLVGLLTGLPHVDQPAKLCSAAPAQRSHPSATSKRGIREPGGRAGGVPALPARLATRVNSGIRG
jgi:hypothetical protein